MEAKTKEKSFVQAWKLNIWAWKLSYKEMPGWYISMFLNGLLNAVTPYVTIWFSARLVAELSGGRSIQTLTHYVVLILVSTAVLMLLKAIVLRWANAEDSMTYDRMRNVFIKKMLGMDFVDIDSQHSILNRRLTRTKAIPISVCRVRLRRFRCSLNPASK